MGDRRRPLDGDQSLWRGPDDVESIQSEQVHIRARVGEAEYAVDIQRVGLGVHLEPLADNDLERLARLDLLHCRAHGPLVRLGRALTADRQGRLAKASDHHACRCGLDQQLGHGLDPSHCVGVRLVNALIGVVEIDGIGHQPYLAAVVI